ncbi:glycosyltransferase family 2 protein [Winogradskyella eckloniae]|uniref:glycosyltransferase family 2 protein n=1 Tax=Winogradskyella eckloniae TaxID=1089306 RepID=UPI001567382D|nr:glycosyltransferase family A protein [Winogradskyella eckloniae]NRD20816.1 glycosyltransferase family 2 protein [Winogradskyella eckloniae]
MSLVSVIIPNYNGLKYIKDTLNSIYDQTYDYIEVIIVDDGSTDGSLEYLMSIDKVNVKVVRNPSQGACAARNYGLRLSKGDYIQFLDNDDLLSRDKIASQMHAISNDDRAIAVCNTSHFYETIDTGVITDWDFLYTTDNPKEFLLNLYGANGVQNMVQTSAWLAPRKLIESTEPWDETLSKDQDGEYFCRVVSRASQVIYVPEIINHYRKHVNGKNIANQKQQKHIDSQLRALASKTKQFKGLEGSIAFKNAMALQYKIIAIDAYPRFKVLSNKAMELSKQFGGSQYLPVLGGRIIEMIKIIFGWKAAKSFTTFVHKNH